MSTGTGGLYGVVSHQQRQKARSTGAKTVSVQSRHMDMHFTVQYKVIAPRDVLLWMVFSDAAECQPFLVRNSH